MGYNVLSYWPFVLFARMHAFNQIVVTQQTPTVVSADLPKWANCRVLPCFLRLIKQNGKSWKEPALASPSLPRIPVHSGMSHPSVQVLHLQNESIGLVLLWGLQSSKIFWQGMSLAFMEYPSNDNGPILLGGSCLCPPGYSGPATFTLNFSLTHSLYPERAAFTS